MPELPEVETIRTYLLQEVKNKIITKVDILDQRIVLNSVISLNNLINQKIIDIKRKGKYLIFIFSSYIMVSHLRMEGKYYLKKETETNSSHARIIFHFLDKSKLIYDDTRRFGEMKLYIKEKFSCEKDLKNVNMDPFNYDKNIFYQIIHSKKKEIKALILDQKIISGIGNIYADEILYKSKISPFKKGSDLSKKETDLIIDNAVIILNDAILQGGSTIKSYHPALGIDGKFQQHLLAYNQNGKPCYNCNTLMVKRFLNGRGTTYCPNCQHVGKVIAIYGKIASGKSTFLNYFKNDNYPTFSCDKEVDLIYKNDLNFTLQCINIFHEECLNEYGKVSKEYIKQVVILDEAKKKQLENIIHPIIKKKAEKFIKNNLDKELLILEVPLLFEAKMDSMMDYIIALDVSIDTQISHLKSRQSKNVSDDMLLNKNHTFAKNISKCDFIIHNDDSLDNLKKQYLDVLEKLKKI